MYSDKNRCEWAIDSYNIIYHDTEWAVPVHEDRVLFEFLILEGAQAGLSWTTILKKRQNYKEAFDYFDPQKIALYDSQKIASLLSNEGIVRNRLKISAAIQNARAFCTIQKEYGSFNTYIWNFVENKPLKHAFKKLADYPTKTKDAEKMSKELLKKGFKFVGPTICYAYMQAVGLVNDHQVSCFRYHEV